MNRDRRTLLEAMLVGFRDELVQKYQEVDQSRPNTQSDETEFEYGLERLAVPDKEKLQAIDNALTRLQLNKYDQCESCGGKISEDLLLKSLPWKTKCPECLNGIGCSVDSKENEEQDFSFN